MTVGNTIVAGNTAATSGPDVFGTFASQGNNLIGETDGSSGWVGSDLTGTIAQPLNPLLAPLGNYGGPTQTMALLPGSPAIDAGSNVLIPAGVTTDQRGEGFILGQRVDIGAYEFTPLSQTISPTPISTQVYGVAAITITATASSYLPVTYMVKSGPATISGSVLTITGAGIVDVEADQAGNATYAPTTVYESFTVTPASLIITANLATEVYGGPLPTLTASYSGFVNNDTAANLTTQPILTTVAITSSPVLSGGYNISVSGASDPNYTISYIDNTLTVNPATLTITANNGSKIYGTLQVLHRHGVHRNRPGDGQRRHHHGGVTENQHRGAGVGELGTYPIVPSAATGSGLRNYKISTSTAGSRSTLRL